MSNRAGAHQKQKTPDSALQRVSDGEVQKQAQQRVRSEGMSLRARKNLKNRRRVLGFGLKCLTLSARSRLKRT